MRDQLLEVHYRPGQEFVLRLAAPRLRDLIPREVAAPLREANRQALLALRAVVDRAIQEFEAREPANDKERIDVT